jgi:hypothetical protein
MEDTVNGKADAWRGRIDAQRVSGQSVRAWCKANDSHEHSFYWWRARLGLSPAKPALSAANGRPSRPPPKPIAFAQVVVRPGGSRRVISPRVVKPKPSAAEPLRLRLTGGGAACRGQRERMCELILPASMPPEQVARLVHAIEAMA